MEAGLTMDAMISSEELCVAAGLLLSLGFSYVPGLSEWFAALAPTYKRLLMLAGLLLVTSRVVFLVPMRCAGTPTPNPYSFLFVYPFVFLAHFLSPSRIHPALPETRRFIWGHSPGDLLLDSLLCGSAREKEFFSLFFFAFFAP
jgi:hypothetical protein